MAPFGIIFFEMKEKRGIMEIYHYYKKTKPLLIVLLIGMLLLAGCKLEDSNPTQETLTREDAGTQYQMDLTNQYKNDKEYREAVANTSDKVKRLEEKVLNLNTQEELLSFCGELELVSMEAENISLYAMLRESLNQSDSNEKELIGISDQLLSNLDELSNEAVHRVEENFNVEELIKNNFYQSNQSKLDIVIQVILDKKKLKHTPTKEMEDVIARTNMIGGSFNEIYTTLTMGENPEEIVEDKDGNQIVVTEENMDRAVAENDTELIEKMEKSMLRSNENIISSIASIFTGEIKKNIFIAQLYGYDSALDFALDSNEIPQGVYTNLIQSTNEHLDYYKKYLLLTNTMGKLEEAMQEDSKSLYDNVKTEYTYQEGLRTIRKGLQPLGSDYLAQLDRQNEERWVDVYPSEKKYTGAFCASSYQGHPYVVINYQDNFYSVLELAHESGHSINSVYSTKTQDFSHYENDIFTAEVASTVNELLLSQSMLDHAKTKEEKLFLLDNLLGTLNLTTYEQVMNAEFEETIYDMAEKGEPLSADAISHVWVELMSKYQGGNKKSLEDSKYDWSIIPHFYDAFYVYQYATSMAASNQVSQSILSKEPEAIPRYLEFLRSGSSKSPVDTLKIVHVDMTQKETFDQSYESINHWNMEMEKLLRELGKDYPEVLKDLNKGAKE